MAGNPFRRNKEGNAPTSISIPPRDSTLTGEADLQNAEDSERRVSSVKRVRIQTPPPISPDPETPVSDDTSIHRVAFEGHVRSPPPLSTGSDAPESSEGGVSDPFSKSFGEDTTLQEALENTRRNSATDVTPSDLGRKVLNPFQKTLATLESSQGSETSGKGNRDGNSKGTTPIVERDVSDKKGSGMDVDDFTRMLMTGANKPHPAGAPAPKTTFGQDSEPSTSSKSSHVSTESSQTSRDLEIESMQEKTPGINKDGQEDEASLSLPKRADTKKSKPPPPKHHRGKSLAQREPQEMKSSNVEGKKRLNTSEPQSSRKELPPLPPNAASIRATSDPSYNGKVNYDSASNATNERNPPVDSGREGSSETRSKRARPPAPLARRSSHRISPNQANLERSQGSMDLPSPSPQTPGSTMHTKSRQAPPPPPSRRQASKGYAPSEQSSISESASIGSDSTAQMDEFPSLDSGSNHRSSNLSGIVGSSRSSSISERNPPLASPPISSPVPPPPRPRRRRGSSRNSGDMVPPPTRMSGDDKGASSEMARSGTESYQRTTSGLTQVPEGDDGNKANSQDVLADLTALQEEVDALRQNYTKAS